MSTTPFTDDLLDSFAPWLAQDVSGSLANYLSALGTMFDPVAALVTDQNDPDDPDYVPGWSVLLDPDNCPTAFLPFLSQFNGTAVQAGTSDAEARAIIKAESGFARGTVSAIVAAATRHLTGTQYAFVLERTPDAYSFELVVRPEQVIDATALTAAVNAVKPAGIVWSLVQTDGWPIFQLEATYALISDMEAAFASVTGLENDAPGT